MFEYVLLLFSVVTYTLENDALVELILVKFNRFVCELIILVFINKYKLGHVMFVFVILAVLKLLVTVKLPENVLFTPAIRNPDDVLECGIIFNTFSSIC